MGKPVIIADFTDRNDPQRFRQSVADWQDLRLAHERPKRAGFGHLLFFVCALLGTCMFFIFGVAFVAHLILGAMS